MPKFRKKPVEVEAIQLVPGLPMEDLFAFTGAVQGFEAGLDGVYIETLEGRMHASPNDWLIRGVQGELYPCKRR